MNVEVHLFTCCCLIRLILSRDVQPTFTAQYLGHDIYIYFCTVFLYMYILFFLQENGGNKCIHKKFRLCL
jgi:hypothetical protein